MRKVVNINDLQFGSDCLQTSVSETVWEHPQVSLHRFAQGTKFTLQFWLIHLGLANHFSWILYFSAHLTASNSPAYARIKRPYRWNCRRTMRWDETIGLHLLLSSCFRFCVQFKVLLFFWGDCRTDEAGSVWSGFHLQGWQAPVDGVRGLSLIRNQHSCGWVLKWSAGGQKKHLTFLLWLLRDGPRTEQVPCALRCFSCIRQSVNFLPSFFFL